MPKGQNPDDFLSALISADEGREQRQIHMIGNAGRGAAHTGAECIDWCGHALHDGFSVAGNMLSGPQVIAATAESYLANKALPFAERLLMAMAAGEAAGGDKRGKQAAALLVYSGQDYPALSIRVDDHAEPLTELRRLYEVSLERFQPFVTCLPSRERPCGITDRGLIESAIRQFHDVQLARKAGA